MGKVIMSGIVPMLKAPSTGILASDLAVGDIVKLTENGTPVEYIVVNQGIPENSSLYDSSCNGTWLLRKDCSLNMIWHENTNALSYNTSYIYSWLNNSYIPSLGAIEQGLIKQVNIPYRAKGAGAGFIIKQISGKAFLLSSYEMGGNIGHKDGGILSYFDSGDETTALNKRIAKYNGEIVSWWTRTGFGAYTLVVNTDGTFIKIDLDINKYVRPALILPFTAKFDKDTKILKG